MEDSRKACGPIEDLARKLGPEIPGKLKFFRRSKPFSPFELDELDARIHEGLSVLEPVPERAVRRRSWTP